MDLIFWCHMYCRSKHAGVGWFCRLARTGNRWEMGETTLFGRRHREKRNTFEKMIARWTTLASIWNSFFCSWNYQIHQSDGVEKWLFLSSLPAMIIVNNIGIGVIAHFISSHHLRKQKPTVMEVSMCLGRGACAKGFVRENPVAAHRPWMRFCQYLDPGKMFGGHEPK